MALIAGGPGLGKTLLGQCFLDRLGAGASSAFLLTTHFRDPAALLQALLFDFELPHEGRSEEALRLALTDHLLKMYEEDRRAVLVVDEAQHLTPAVLEELRLLGNLEGKKGKVVQVVLLALPSILETLQLPELESFQQRLAARAELRPFDQHESTDYLLHQARRFCTQPEELITEEALQVIVQSTQGIPRLLNRAMQKALSLAVTGGAESGGCRGGPGGRGGLGLVQDEQTPFTMNEVRGEAGPGSQSSLVCGPAPAGVIRRLGFPARIRGRI